MARQLARYVRAIVAIVTCLSAVRTVVRALQNHGRAVAMSDAASAEVAATRTDDAEANAGQERLGEMLLRQGVITAEQLERALAMKERSGERLGRILLTIGAVHRQQMYAVLAELWGVPFVDCIAAPPPLELVRMYDRERMVREGWVPLARDGDSAALVASVDQPSEARAALLADRLGVDEVRFAATTDWDVQHVIRQAFAVEIAHDAANGVAERDPLQSARGGLALWQKVSVLLGAAVLGAGLLWDWVATLTVLCAASSLVFLAAVCFKVIAVGTAWRGLKRGEQAQGERIPDDELPVYTVLVPVYKEANIVGGLVAHLSQLDYPKEKLEILLLMEEDDTETIAAARAASPPEMVRFLIIPEGQPQTKPRACNVGLFFARGEYLVIYDAEDRPEPGQLRDAVAAFRTSSEEVVCVQARLNYFNAGENLLTRMFTLEYSYWFDYMLPGLDALGLPIPLGGTSNHFKVDALRGLGGWDAYNVTEDADLGLRANAEGFRVGVIASTTYEEACSKLRPWIRQRTRWIKGYMQTAIVHSRRPWTFLRTAGGRGIVGFGLLIFGTPLIFLINPILWTIFAIWVVGYFTGEPLLPDIFPGIWWYIAMFNLIVGNVLMIGVNALAVVRRRLYGLAPWALANPAYWFLHSWAAWRALYQLIRKPFYWEKTPHGLSHATPSLGIHLHVEESVPAFAGLPDAAAPTPPIHTASLYHPQGVVPAARPVSKPRAATGAILPPPAVTAPAAAVVLPAPATPTPAAAAPEADRLAGLEVVPLVRSLGTPAPPEPAPHPVDPAPAPAPTHAHAPSGDVARRDLAPLVGGTDERARRDLRPLSAPPAR